MRIAVGCDHAGFTIKNAVVEAVKAAGHEVLDLGTFNQERVDYPDYAEKVGRAILSGEADKGIVICSTGIGVCVTANKMKGIYAGLCHDTYSAHQAVEHDNINVLCLGGLIVGPQLAREIVTSFLQASLFKEERYQKRIDKYKAVEKEFFK
jgi:ribose 5-phosphate isomerase B